ncbi:MAG: folylpolyglutamate synthase/dihydrofolate synthase family protein [Tetrasphaera sp.]
MSPAPDAAQREANRRLQLTKRMRAVDRDILARAPEHDLQPDLARITAVMELLGDPQRSFPAIHITGTNGKTTTARLIAGLLQGFGLTVGRFTSPHLHHIRERIAIGGEPVSEERFLAAYDDVLPFIEIVDARSLARGGPRMTYFEVLVALAYAAFADAPVDVAVIEVGMGGSWDATNVIDGQVAVVTPVAMDHAHFLGDTIEQIATEKAGIIKADALAVSGVQEPEVAEILVARAGEVGARVAFEGNDFGVLARDVAVGGQQLTVRGLAGDYRDLFLALHGAHQAHNAAMALAATEAFLGGGEQPLDIDIVRQAFAEARSPGRLEIVRRSPTVLVDAAHNPAGTQALATALREEFTFTKLVGVIAILADKDAVAMLEILEPVLEEVVISRSTSPRAMDPDKLGAIAVEVFGEHRVVVEPDLPTALDRAAELADEGGVGGGVVATGSVTTAADVRLLLGADDA